MDNIKQIIEKCIKELKITHLDISFNELADMYETGELIITPEYQRTFRWDIGKQSRFIESLLLEMPVPPIYVIELEDGTYELIDGLQRISSYLSYRNLLKTDDDFESEIASNSNTVEELENGIADEPDIRLQPGFPLDECDIINELNGCYYSDLQASMQIKLKRAYVRLEVLRKGINPEMKYQMFKRLNTGGEKLEPQEIRNCTIRLINDKFINFIKELKIYPHFKNTISKISEVRIKKRFDEDLVLRFFAFKNFNAKFKHKVDVFLTQYMETISLNDAKKNNSFDYIQERVSFFKTFQFLDESCGDTVFCTVNPKTSSPGVFNGYIFEAVTVGLQKNLDALIADRTKYDAFKSALNKLKIEPGFRDATVGGGKNSPGPLRLRIQKVSDMVEGLFHDA
jgi:uncharacterized protein with ParB-like and HNH nuclease domain